MRLGIVVGLDGEARLARRLGGSVLVGISGATAHGASQAAAGLVAAGATHLLSFGLAAGLDPSFQAGDVLVPARVVADGTAYDTDPALRALLGTGSAAPLLHSDAVVSQRAMKAALWASSGCGSLDMESGAVARAAVAAGLPFAVLRAVCDPAGRTLAPAACVPLRADGRLQASAILRSILRRPGQLPGLIALGRDAGRATAALSKRLSRLAPALTTI